MEVCPRKTFCGTWRNIVITQADLNSGSMRSANLLKIWENRFLYYPIG